MTPIGFLAIAAISLAAAQSEPKPSDENLVIAMRGGVGYGDVEGLKLVAQPGLAVWLGRELARPRVGLMADYTFAGALWNINWSAATVAIGAQSSIRNHMRLEVGLGAGGARVWDSETCSEECEPPPFAESTYRPTLFGALGWQIMTVDSPRAAHWGALGRVSALRSVQDDPLTVVAVTGGGCVAF